MDCSRKPPRHFTMIPHCSLCGEKFSLDTYFHLVVLPDEYQNPVLTRPISFQGNGQRVTLQDLNIEIYSDPQLRSENAPSVHYICWAVLADQSSIQELRDLGLAMTPLNWTELPQSIFKDSFTLSEAIRLLSSEFNQGDREWTTLCELLERIGSLPPELVAIVWDSITPCDVRRLLALWAARSIRPTLSFATGSATVCLRGNILVYHTWGLHGSYICGIRQGYKLYGRECGSPDKIMVPSSIAAFTFTLGSYGLRRMDFLTDHGSRGGSAVKGNEFIGFIRQPAVPLYVDVEWDALKISRVSCHNKLEFGHDFLWVNPLPWTQLCPLSAESFYDWPRHSDFARQPQRFMAYIPLRKEGSSLYGLTAFCSGKGLVGLGTHFHSRSHSAESYWYGEQNGCPVHVQFGSSETVSLISVFWHKNDRLFKAYLAVTTSKGRTVGLGPCIPASDVVTKNIFSASDGDILGLYYDKSPGINRFTSLGAVCRPGSSPHGRVPNRSVPQLPRRSDMIDELNASPFNGFASHASLENIKVLKACYLGSRCRGMLLIYDDDTRSTLGQWYESTHAQPDIQVVPFQHDNVLRFYLEQHDNHQFLSRVESLSKYSCLETTDMAVDVMYGDDIIWLFSAYSDIILRGSN